MKITDDNYKGISLEAFVDFDLEELYLLEEVLDSVKNNKPIIIRVMIPENARSFPIVPFGMKLNSPIN